MTTSVTTFEQDWAAWHSDREEYFRDPLGWVALTGLYWLTETDAAVGDLPGVWRADDDTLHVTASAGDGLSVDGVVVDGTVALHPVEGAPGLLVAAGERRVEVIRRTGSVALRVHDPAAPTLASFGGIPTFAPDEKWRVSGTFTPYDSERTVTTAAVVEGLEHHHAGLGVIDFTLGNAPQQFVAFRGKAGGFHILFTDETSGVSTYPACRSLAVGDADADGLVTLDFNRASNLPCALTDYATCPVAPPENRLTVAVEAGEKLPIR
ncbi:DUF1684 domain-containing protein [Rhodococcus sp. SORGH_AS_0303]|uniref:DUF1684 domain-containing protein n=1 Tax=Rhodococcus sp. SORGH_AS_0303 TaxID=3041753 RepID=UPI00277FB2CE|nr:DUF1684 domain-containing protein [Rhodococcus sp. SORGH_AS_0303]MDQ1199932.1 uncharacterized protein (DUF1684 family) [Rhodococcus sp. SORGH_AS_0303]